MENRTIKFEPRLCRDHEVPDPKHKAKKLKRAPLFTGGIVLRVPGFDERYELLELQDVKVVDGVIVASEGMNPFRAVRTVVAFSKKFYLEVGLKRIKDGAEFKSFDDLSADPECDEILMEVAQALRGGFKPGEP
jgi:hypothetical protein